MTDSPSRTPSHPRRTWWAVLTATALACAAVLPGSFLARADPGPTTIVSFTLDDGLVSQNTGADILAQHGMRGTFYIVSGSVGTPGYLTHADLRRIADAGHEIGGHTVNHPDLTTTRPNEVRRQICQDRANLTRWGYQVTSFAFPYNTHTASTEAVARDCGYNSARALGDVYSPTECVNCDPGETMPPRKPFAIRAPGTLNMSTTLADLQKRVLRAEEAGGGWVPLVMHQTCDYCGDLAISPSVLDSFAGWLAQRESRGTAVRTVDQVVGGPVQPVVDAPPAETPNTLANASLELSGSSVQPRGWAPGGWGRNEPVWTRTRDAHSGEWATRLDIANHVDGDAKLMPELDLGAAAPAARPGRTYTVSTWYKATAPTELALYYRNRTGAWKYWASSPNFAPADQWQRAAWTSPPAPPDATGLSFGLALFSNGSVTTDDYAVEPGPAPSLCDRLQLWKPLRWICG